MSLSESFSKLVKDKDVAQSHEAKLIGARLLELEVLYLLNFSPKPADQLQKSIAEIFGIEFDFETLLSCVHSLEKYGFVRGINVASQTIEIDKKYYTITSNGSLALNRGIEGLSRIVLTMQLTMKQPLLKA